MLQSMVEMKMKTRSCNVCGRFQETNVILSEEINKYLCGACRHFLHSCKVSKGSYEKAYETLINMYKEIEDEKINNGMKHILRRTKNFTF